MDRDGKPGTEDTVASTPAYSETLANTGGPLTASGPPPLWSDSSPLARYLPGALLGRGGMGEVTSARDAKIGRSVAIKRMRTAAASPDAIARFVREARIQAGLEHPAIVPVHDLGEDEHGQPYFIMKQLAGVALGDVLARLSSSDATAAKTYSRQRLLRAFADVCLAVEFAHQRGVLHRDLKPANIVLGEFGEVYVIDWGIARVTGDGDTERVSFVDIDTLDTQQTVAGTVLGTPGFMSPEQIRGDSDLDGRADVYALGCILFELLTLVPLHPRGVSGMHTALAGVTPTPSETAPDRAIPPELDTICLRAVRSNRTDRFATARELGEAVQGYLDGDRDLALRRDLARVELEAARAALVHGNEAADHQTAMRSAARALALDPTQRESVELVSRLMLQPPREMPEEVATTMTALDRASYDEVRPFIQMSGVVFFAFTPILWWVGFRNLWQYGAGLLCAIAILGLSSIPARAPNFTAPRLIALTWAALIVVFGVMTTPVLVVPGLAAVVAMSCAAHPEIWSPRLIAGMFITAILGPWGLAALDVLPQTVTVVGNTIVLHADTPLHSTAVYVGLVAFIVQIIVFAALVASRLAKGRRDAQRAVQLQAWQLRQLVPRADDV